MATSEPISYTYVPTPLRSKSTTVCRKIPLKPFSIAESALPSLTSNYLKSAPRTISCDLFVYLLNKTSAYLYLYLNYPYSNYSPNYLKIEEFLSETVSEMCPAIRDAYPLAR